MTNKTKDFQEEAKKVEERVTKLSGMIIDFLSDECQKDNYLAAELYMSLKCAMAMLAKGLGPAVVKQIENAFMLVGDKDDIMTC